MLKKILIAVAIVVVGFVVMVSTRPATFHVERSTTVSAPPDAVFAQVTFTRGPTGHPGKRWIPG
jgi:hypothetical protein